MSSFETQYATLCQIGMVWKIQENDLHLHKEGRLESKTFPTTIPGLKYFLALYPKSCDENNQNEVKMFLYLDFDTPMKVIANCTVTIKSATKNLRFSNYIYEKSDGFGMTLCTHNELVDPAKKYFVDGIMDVEFSGNLQPKEIKLKALEPLSLAKVLWESDYKDVTIVAEKNEIKVHKIILCAFSDYFIAELNTAFIEAKENKIEIPDFAFETVKIFVEFCYERDIKDLINEENASELLHFADKYNIKTLHICAQTILIEKISKTNICDFANMSITSNATNLREFCICFLINLAKNSIIIDGIEELEDQIMCEIGRRSFLTTSN